MKKILLLLTLLCLLAPAGAHAEQFGLYLAPKLIYGVQNFDMKESVPNGSIGLGSHSENVFGAGLAVGYDFGLYSALPVRAELEYATFTEAKASASGRTLGLAYNASGKVYVYSLCLNAYYDFRNETRFTPYLGAGLGMSFVSMKGSDSGNDYGIIKGVEAVFTGIDGTSITVWDQTDAMTEANKDKSNNKIVAGDPLAWGIYTLYNNNGLVIASVVVGEGSSAKDLVYVTSADLSREEDNGGSVKAAGDGLWTFYREVVRNGETVMLTEVGDNVDALSRANMKQHEWYQVKLDGNGNVIKSEPAFSALTGRGVFEPDYNEINNTVEQTGVDTVLYQTDAGPNTMKGEIAGQFTHTGFGANDKLEVKGNNTLAVNTLVGSGIYFRNDVHVVLEYWNRNTQETDVMVGEGVDDLKDMVEFVNENSAAAIKKQGRRLANENYYVSALIEGGDAFRALGEEEDAPTLEGELCYRDDAGAICRCWNWRDGQRTALSDDSEKAFLIIESVDPARAYDLQAAIDELTSLVEQHLGATVFAKKVVTADDPTMVIDE